MNERGRALGGLVYCSTPNRRAAFTLLSLCTSCGPTRSTLYSSKVHTLYVVQPPAWHTVFIPVSARGVSGWHSLHGIDKLLCMRHWKVGTVCSAMLDRSIRGFKFIPPRHATVPKGQTRRIVLVGCPLIHRIVETPQ